MKLLYLQLLPLKLAEMWQWILHHDRRPQYDELHQVIKARDHAFLVQHNTPNPNGPVTLVPGESQLLTSVSIDYSSLLTSEESIIETPRDPKWDLNLGTYN